MCRAGPRFTTPSPSTPACARHPFHRRTSQMNKRLASTVAAGFFGLFALAIVPWQVSASLLTTIEDGPTLVGHVGRPDNSALPAGAPTVTPTGTPGCEVA